MRVLHVINSLATGGAERLLVDLCSRLRDRGVDCRVLVLTDRGDRFGAELLERGVPLRVASPGSSPYAPSPIWGIRAALRREKPDVVHVHLFPAQYWCALAAIGFSEIRFVTTEHNSRNRRMDNPALAPLERAVYRRYDRVIAISRGVEEALHRHLGASTPVALIPNGIDLAHFQGWGGRNRTADGLVRVGMAARFVPQKDQETIIRALALLPPTFRAAFAGDGETKTAMEALTRDLGVLDRVEFLGDLADVRPFLANLDIYVQSSRWEGFGIAALEAMASGLPVAASDLPGLRDVLGPAGRLFMPGEPAVLAKTLSSWMDSTPRRMAGEACAQQAKTFDIEATVDALIRLYTDVTGKAPPMDRKETV